MPYPTFNDSELNVLARTCLETALDDADELDLYKGTIELLDPKQIFMMKYGYWLGILAAVALSVLAVMFVSHSDLFPVKGGVAAVILLAYFVILTTVLGLPMSLANKYSERQDQINRHNEDTRKVRAESAEEAFQDLRMATKEHLERERDSLHQQRMKIEKKADEFHQLEEKLQRVAYAL